ncbi:MAG TPA: hypothetical protein PKE16_11395 [Hyphomicrobium sp.]|nr:hypothetical protein [Hyphomicrobium sp.]
MASDLLTSRQRMERAVRAVPRKKRDRSEAPLVIALLIGAIAAMGIILVANSDKSEPIPGRAPAVQLNGK